LQQIVREAWIIALGLHVEVEIKNDSLFMVCGGDSIKAALLCGLLEMKFGINDHSQILPAILEKTFQEICCVLQSMRMVKFFVII